MSSAIYNNVSYPHPYLVIWLQCRRHTDSMTGVMPYPEPEKGYLEQDAELMLAFEVLDEIQDRREALQKRRDEVKEQVAAMHLNQ